MVFDCIPFFNELDILKLRMQIMAPYVDFFVIEEATVTFSGEPKRMIFAENRHLFAAFEGKIRYVAVEDSPLEGVTTHERDKYQKNQLIRALSDAKPEDIIIFSDVDEIPNPETLAKLMERFASGKIYHLAQRMFYCFLNMEEVSGNLLSITGEFREWRKDSGWARKSAAFLSCRRKESYLCARYRLQMRAVCALRTAAGILAIWAATVNGMWRNESA